MLSMSEISTAGGLRLVRVELSLKYTPAEAAEVDREIAPGGRFHGLKMLVVMLPGTEVAAETREVMAKMNRVALEGAGVVVPSGPLRIFASFIFRVLGLKSATVHADEAAAMAALESRR
jgi:hypothetical protein